VFVISFLVTVKVVEKEARPQIGHSLSHALCVESVNVCYAIGMIIKWKTSVF
jgi:hypothetical protein